jgi:hypothetical protein
VEERNDREREQPQLLKSPAHQKQQEQEQITKLHTAKAKGKEDPSNESDEEPQDPPPAYEK